MEPSVKGCEEDVLEIWSGSEFVAGGTDRNKKLLTPLLSCLMRTSENMISVFSGMRT